MTITSWQVFSSMLARSSSVIGPLADGGIRMSGTFQVVTLNPMNHLR